jgi:hypothetical protein
VKSVPIYYLAWCANLTALAQRRNKILRQADPRASPTAGIREGEAAADAGARNSPSIRWIEGLLLMKTG